MIRVNKTNDADFWTRCGKIVFLGLDRVRVSLSLIKKKKKNPWTKTALRILNGGETDLYFIFVTLYLHGYTNSFDFFFEHFVIIYFARNNAVF